jgi:hypothetical protein
VNKLRFRGRVRGRALPEGAYRLVFRDRRASARASVIVVVAHGRVDPATLRQARRGSSCGQPDTALATTTPAPVIGGGSGGGIVAAKAVPRVASILPVEGAIDAIVNRARGVKHRIDNLIEDSPPLDTPLVVALAVAVLASSLLGVFVLTQLIRQLRDDY